jgi:imidazolonepropionase-like amidohydrolase
MDGEHVWLDQTVIIAGQRIRAIGPAARVNVPKDAKVIAGMGSFLIPGLADMHVHFTIPAVDSRFDTLNRAYALQLVAHGVTTVRNMRGFAELLEFRRRIASGDVLGPEIFTTGPGNNGDLEITPYDRKLDTEAQAIRAVQVDKVAGFDGIKVYGAITKGPYRALIAEARRISIPVYGHVPYAVGLNEVLAEHQASIEHLTGYLDALNSPDTGRTLRTSNVSALREYREDLLQDLAAATRVAGVWNCPTLVFLAAFSERCKGLPRIQFKFAEPPNCGGTLRSVSIGHSPRGSDDKPQVSPFAISIMRALHQNGARILAGTDADGTYVVHGSSIHQELESVVATGYSPYEALAAATSNAAEFLNRQEDAGTITVGKLANLVLLHGNPLLDIRYTNQRVGVMIRGQWYPQQQLDYLFAQALARTGPYDFYGNGHCARRILLEE